MTLPRADLPRYRFRVACLNACAIVLVMLAARGFIALSACDVVDDVGHEFKNIGADLAEVSYCEVADCGEVFLCTMPDGVENEWCWVDDNASELLDASGALSCVPTPRGGALGWPCLYCCGDKCGRGANAFQGCFCTGD